MTEKLPLNLDLVPLDLAWADPARNVALCEEAISSRLKASPESLLSRGSSFSRRLRSPLSRLRRSASSRSSAIRRRCARWRRSRKNTESGRCFGFPEKVGGSEKPYNTLLFVSPDGEEAADYHKVHLYTAGITPEADHYLCGDTASLVHYRGWRIAFGICFDLRFPSLFHSYAREGADLVILPACWIGGPGKAEQFRILSAARAIEGQFFFAALNRSGKDPAYSYEGDVLCFSPKGVPIAASPGGSFDLDPALLEDARQLLVRGSDRDEYPVVIS